MLSNQNVLIVAAVVLLIGILLGVRIAVYFANTFRDNYRNRSYQRSFDHRGEGHRHPEYNNGGSSFFGFILLIIVGFLVYFLGKSAFTKLNLTDLKVAKNEKLAEAPAANDYIWTQKPPAGNTAPEKSLVQKTPAPPAQAQPAPAIVEAQPAQKQFLVRFGSFQHLDGARRKIRTLENWGISARYDTKIQGNEKFYVVIAGPYPGETAELVRREVDAKAIVMPYEQ